MAIPAATEWAEYTRTSNEDKQLNTRLAPVTWDAVDELAKQLRLTRGALTRLLLTALVDGETISAAKLLKIASAPVTPS